jgi:hypothetical protein
LRSEENFARGRQGQRLGNISAESEEHVTQEKDAGGAIADGVMRGEDKGAVRFLMEKYSTKERSLIGSERCVYFFGDLPLPPGGGRCNHAQRNTLAGDAAKVRNTVKRCVDTGREQRVALLHCVERVAPLLYGCVAGDLGRKCAISGKALVEEAEDLFKSAERPEKITGLECDRPKFNRGRRHEISFQV